MNWLNPYAWLGALVIVAGLFLGGWALGHSAVSARDHTITTLTGERDAARAESTRFQNAYAIANRGLEAARAAFGDISAQATTDAARGELAAAKGERAAAESAKDEANLQAQIKALNQRIKDLSTGCVDASRPVCGVLQ